MDKYIKAQDLLNEIDVYLAYSKKNLEELIDEIPGVYCECCENRGCAHDFNSLIELLDSHVPRETECERSGEESIGSVAHTI